MEHPMQSSGKRALEEARETRNGEKEKYTGHTRIKNTSLAAQARVVVRPASFTSRRSRRSQAFPAAFRARRALSSRSPLGHSASVAATAWAPQRRQGSRSHSAAHEKRRLCLMTTRSKREWH